MPLPTSKVAICNMALDAIGERRVSDIDSPTNDTERLLSNQYDAIRQEVMRSYVWNCCKKRAYAALINASRTISGATAANPGVFTTSSAHGFTTGDVITITGMAGGSFANVSGDYTATVVTSTSFSIGLSTVGYGTYTASSGSARIKLFDFTDAYQLPTDLLRFLSAGGEKEAWRNVDFDIESGGRLLLNNSGATSIPIRYIADVEDVSRWDSLLRRVIVDQLALECAYQLSKSKELVVLREKKLAISLQEAISVDGIEVPPIRYEPSKILTERLSMTSLDDPRYPDFS